MNKFLCIFAAVLSVASAHVIGGGYGIGKAIGGLAYQQQPRVSVINVPVASGYGARHTGYGAAPAPLAYNVQPASVSYGAPVHAPAYGAGHGVGSALNLANLALSLPVPAGVIGGVPAPLPAPIYNIAPAPAPAYAPAANYGAPAPAAAQSSSAAAAASWISGASVHGGSAPAHGSAAY